MFRFKWVLLFFFIGTAQAANVNVQADLLVPSCLVQQGKNSFVVDCSPDHPGYELQTLLSEHAILTDGAKPKKVNLYVSETPMNCDKALPSMRTLSANMPIRYRSDGSVKEWYYCLLPQTGIEGQLNITLSPLSEYPSNTKVLDVQFEHGSAEVSTKTQQLMQDFLQSAGELAKYRVEVRAHSSEIGTSFYNDQLSEKRRSVIVAYLLLNTSWTQTEITSQAFGEAMPAVLSHDPTMHAWNRRVNIVLIPKFSSQNGE